MMNVSDTWALFINQNEESQQCTNVEELILDRRNSKCEVSKVETCLACLKNIGKAIVAGVEWWRGKVVVNVILAVVAQYPVT